MRDNDLIRRGDAREILEDEGFLERSLERLAAIPAVQPTVKPLRYIEPEGETLEQMRDHARQHPLAQSGDMRLVWVNEGDLHMHTIFHGAQPTVSPEQPVATTDVAALVEALKMMCEEFRGYDLPYGSKAYSQATATLAEIKK